MTATAHALVGGAVAASTQNVPLGVVISFASHPFLDMIPHWDFGWGWRKKTKLVLLSQSLIDLGLGIILAYFLFYPFIGNLWYFLLAVLASEAWDIAQVPYWLFRWNFPPFSTIYKIQSSLQGKAKLPWGILTQVASVLLIVLSLRIFN